MPSFPSRDDPSLAPDDPVGEAADLEGMSLLSDAPADEGTLPPGVTLPDDLTEIATLLGTDAVDLLVAEIRQQGDLLLALQREIADGVELATEQVQDKRIEFLERGPDVQIEDVFLAVMLTFLLESPIAAGVVTRAFRFAGNATRVAFLATRAAKVARLRERARGAAIPLREAAAIRAQLRLNAAEAAKATRGRRHGLAGEARTLQEQLRSLTADANRLLDVGQRAADLEKSTPVDAKRLRAFLKSVQERTVETAVAGAKAGAAAADKSGDDPVPPEAADSIGVQLLKLARRHVRDMEAFFSQINADAELLRGLAASAPGLRTLCAAMLAEIYLAQQGTVSKEPLPDDVTGTVAVEVEKAVWAILSLPDLPRPPKRLAPHIEREIDAAPSAIKRGSDVPVSVAYGWQRKPPARLLDYWRARFFDPDDTDEDIAEKMRQTAERFLRGDGSALPFRRLLPLAYRKDPPAPAEPPE